MLKLTVLIWIGLQKKRWRGSFFLLPVQPMNETGWVRGQFFGLIHDDCVRVCDGEAMVGVMCVGPLVVVVVISLGIQKKAKTYKSRIPCKTGNVQVVVFFYSLEGINDQSIFTAPQSVRRFRSLGTKSWRGMGLEAQDAQVNVGSQAPTEKQHQQLLDFMDFIWCL